jgi:hypothetical protein
MRRREFITLIGSTAAAWPLAARAQQPTRMRRIGVLAQGAANDPETAARLTAFVQGLQELGWSVGRNARIEYRWSAASFDLVRKYAAELVALTQMLSWLPVAWACAPCSTSQPPCRSFSTRSTRLAPVS